MSHPKDYTTDGSYRMTDEVVERIRQGFLLSGGSPTFAAKRAGIAESTLYKWLREFPDFKKEMEELGTELSEKSIGNLSARITSGDAEISKWWLERREKDMFSTKSINETDMKVAGELTLADTITKKVNAEASRDVQDNQSNSE